MTTAPLETENLLLVVRSPAEVQAEIEAMPPVVKKELSAEWLQRIAAGTTADLWLHGFALVHRGSGTLVGTAAFKAPPSADGTVEIAYGVAPEHQGKGYAAEAARALTTFAFASGRVRLVRAHTRPEPNASTRVLAKSGFRFVGQAVDPEDGLVWRWEKACDTT